MATQVYPYTDELMRWDDTEQRYFLTEKALVQNGIDLRARLAQSKTASPEILITRMIRTFTNAIYRYIHKFNFDNSRQDFLIGTIPSLRAVLYRALVEQAIYICSLGDPTLSFDETLRKMDIAPNAIGELQTTLPELGANILYCGFHMGWW